MCVCCRGVCLLWEKKKVKKKKTKEDKGIVARIRAGWISKWTLKNSKYLTFNCNMTSSISFVIGNSQFQIDRDPNDDVLSILYSVWAQFLFLSLKVKHENVLNKVVCVCSAMKEPEQDHYQYNIEWNKKAESILSDCSHPLQQQFLPSGTVVRFPTS